jgi:hypothetical protein
MFIIGVVKLISMQLVENRDQWWVLVDMVMNLWAP